MGEVTPRFNSETVLRGEWSKRDGESALCSDEQSPRTDRGFQASPETEVPGSYGLGDVPGSYVSATPRLLLNLHAGEGSGSFGPT